MTIIEALNKLKKNYEELVTWRTPKSIYEDVIRVTPMTKIDGETLWQFSPGESSKNFTINELTSENWIVGTLDDFYKEKFIEVED